MMRLGVLLGFLAAPGLRTAAKQSRLQQPSSHSVVSLIIVKEHYSRESRTCQTYSPTCSVKHPPPPSRPPHLPQPPAASPRSSSTARSTMLTPTACRIICL